MKNKTVKILILLIIVLLIIMLPKLVVAKGGIVEGADSFLNSAKGSPIKQEGLKEASDIVYNTFLIIGVVAAMVGITALGIKFMIGSTEEKAKVKETLIPFTVGCVILAFGFVIWKIVILITQNFN